jgi:acyl-CoA thioesterase-2
MHPNVELMLAALNLSPEASTLGDDVFTAPSIKMMHNRVYGGQVMAQSLLAAIRTVDDDRTVHSMHGYFLRPGDDTQPITFAVDRIHDGRSFSTRRTQAYQNGVPIFSMIASFQVPDEGLDHFEAMPAGIAQPEDLPSPAELFADVQDPRAAFWVNQRPFDLRYVNGPIYLEVTGPHVAHQAIWMRCLDTLPADPSVHLAALAYASDYPILEPIYRRHGVPWATPGLKAASLDHAMWFHRPVKADEWLLYVQESPSAQGGRGLGIGRIFSRDGVLVATVAQEGMIRFPVVAPGH